MSADNWITFAVIVGLCLIPLGVVAVWEWQANREKSARLREVNRQIYEDWETAQRRARLAHLNVPARKGIDARRHSIVGFRAKKDAR